MLAERQDVKERKGKNEATYNVNELVCLFAMAVFLLLLDYLCAHAKVKNNAEL